MRVYNLSTNRDDYYSQRNNVISPSIACKPTATVEALFLARWPLPTGEYEEPEDNLTAWCHSSEGYRKLSELSPDNAGAIPNEDWRVVAWAINNVFLPNDQPVIGPRWNWDLREVLFGITRQRPFAASTFLTPSGHIVVVVGFVTSQEEDVSDWRDIDLSKVTEITIDDPYGNRTSGSYGSDLDGWNNHYPLETWLKVWRSTGIQIQVKS